MPCAVDGSPLAIRSDVLEWLGRAVEERGALGRMALWRASTDAFAINVDLNRGLGGD